MTTVAEKLSALRDVMRANDVAAVIIANADPHNSEYAAPHWCARSWVSDFTGSAGTVVVTLDDAGLWTDSRYHISAEALLEGSPIKLHKQGLPDVDNFPKWLADNLPKGSTVAIDGRTFTVNQTRQFTKPFEKSELELRTDLDLPGQVWSDRPALPDERTFEHDLKYCGKPRTEKIADILAKTKEEGADAHFLSALDDIAWTLNVRLEDTLPSFGHGYVYIADGQNVYFADEKNLLPGLKEVLEADGITIQPYAAAFDFIKSIDKSTKVLIDTAWTGKYTFDLLSETATIVEAANPSRLMKSIKNQTEIENTRNAHLKDGIAMVNFLHWLDQSVGSIKVTEQSAAAKLETFRREQPLNHGISFNTIPAYKGNGAMAHYSPEEEVELLPEGLFLLDSGGQYLDGLTDTTRTLALGPITDEEKLAYTVTLQGMMDVCMTKYIKGTKGCHLDILARRPMWAYGINFGHGTGHGVGYFLNVHEGPQGISPALTDVPLEVGMMTTVEPGVYEAGKFGIRIENIVLTQEDEKTRHGQFYSFETLTMVPIDKKPILVELLSPEQREFFNNYHATVYEKIAPHVSDEVRAWLKEATAAI